MLDVEESVHRLGLRVYTGEGGEDGREKGIMKVSQLPMLHDVNQHLWSRKQ